MLPEVEPPETCLGPALDLHGKPDLMWLAGGEGTDVLGNLQLGKSI